MWRVSDIKFFVIFGIPRFRRSRPALNRQQEQHEILSAKISVPFLVHWPNGQSRRRPDEASICCDGALFLASTSRH